MEGTEIKVTKEEQFATFRQVVTPDDQVSVVELFTSLVDLYRAGKITGHMTVNFNQGGVRNFVTDQIARVPDGSEADRVFDGLFGK